MPIIGLLHLLIAIGFVVHANKTGRPQYWMFILLFVPFAGSIAYVLFELLPELANSRRSRRVVSDIRTVVDPHREYRQLGERAMMSGTVDTKCKFAEECERKGMWQEAIDLYREVAQGLYANDPEMLRRLARAELGAGDAKAAMSTLDRLRAAHPDYQNQDAHLTYARALERWAPAGSCHRVRSTFELFRRHGSAHSVRVALAEIGRADRGAETAERGGACE